ncbi:hypothetical protein FIV42_04620 [Persicimonas caeni]|uniref:Uncharacterized protein n=1 Tax=Persicimonas caeni TaxID=2292766 RepID=A0A4Y6PNY9_PERCE|nr:hypothetical protein [Persicimonas caeni]QDG50046.1 hypothetical protein FIV42_04620 [Persicimonas caeni]QED31267.1 hypothetical protein FRD00_04615 [Persicimonas caeni]
MTATATVTDKESGEYAEAMTRLIAARDRARRDYLAARDILAGALRLEDSDDLTQMMPPLSAIYQPSRDPEADADPEPGTDPEPVEA